MKVKKQKRHRKVVRFFSTCFGFREPFKVFCDGTFIHHLICHGLVPAEDTLAHLLGGRVLLFTSRCVLAELKRLGTSHAEAFRAAEQLTTARCDHERPVAASKCTVSVVGEGNAEHFFVATLCADLRKKFSKVAGVPVIYCLKNSLFLEQPSKHQREYVASAEEKRLHMNKSEYEKLHKRVMDRSEDHPIDLPSEHHGSASEVMKTQATRNTDTMRRKLGVADISKFKRKIAKGPNPLSCKKKKKKESSSSAQNQVKLSQEGDADSGTKRKRIRKRKRAHKAGKSEESS